MGGREKERERVGRVAMLELCLEGGFPILIGFSAVYRPGRLRIVSSTPPELHPLFPLSFPVFLVVQYSQWVVLLIRRTECESSVFLSLFIPLFWLVVDCRRLTPKRAGYQSVNTALDWAHIRTLDELHANKCLVMLATGVNSVSSRPSHPQSHDPLDTWLYYTSPYHTAPYSLYHYTIRY